jgi:stage V sporulation protein SpoVS
MWLSFSADESSGFAPAVPEVAAAMEATVDKEAAYRRAVEGATTKAVTDKEAADKRATGEAAVKQAADKVATNKRVVEETVVNEASVGAVGDSSAPGHAPSSAAGAMKASVPSGSTPPAKRPYRGIWKPQFI